MKRMVQTAALAVLVSGAQSVWSAPMSGDDGHPLAPAATFMDRHTTEMSHSAFPRSGDDGLSLPPAWTYSDQYRNEMRPSQGGAFPTDGDAFHSLPKRTI